jgi:imidazolonepropionase-like amidohydrolase
MRGVILGERLRTGKRFGPWLTPAEALWEAATHEGARALGFPDAGGTLEIGIDNPTLALVEDVNRLDAIVFSGSPALVTGVRRT